MAIPIKVLSSGRSLLRDIRDIIEQARQQVGRHVNAGLVRMNWSIGKRIKDDILYSRRAEYGETILATLSQELTRAYGRGYAADALSRMVQFAQSFPDPRIVAALSRQLGWSHFVELIPLDDPLRRDFYAEMCRLERWSVRMLRSKIGGMLFERTALSRKPERLVRLELTKLRAEDRLSPDLVFRDPYFLDFLGLKGAYQEKDLEAAILREMEAFILELGVGFAFVSRQKRVQVGAKDHYLDLLFYHRGLGRLVAVELKLDRFKPEYKGQMELYLRWLDRHEKRRGEGSPVGLILCAGAEREEVELLQLDRSGIRVAQYLTDLPPRAALERKLHDALRAARERLGNSP